MSQPSFTHSFTRKTHRTPSAALAPDTPSLSAESKTVLVTAGVTGIGRSISTAFAQANVTNLILLSRRESVLTTAAKELESAYPATKVHCYACDVTNLARVQEVFKEVKNKIGEIDIVVSSHCPLQGAFPVATTPAELLLENFNGIVMGNVNLINTFLEFFPPSRPSVGTGSESRIENEGKEKNFINISSTGAHVSGLYCFISRCLGRISLPHTLSSLSCSNKQPGPSPTPKFILGSQSRSPLFFNITTWNSLPSA